MAKHPVNAKAEHPAIERKRTLDIRDPQMDVPDADTRVDRLAVDADGRWHGRIVHLSAPSSCVQPDGSRRQSRASHKRA